MTAATKMCSKCGARKVFGDFYIDRIKKDGHASTCKSCVKARFSEWVKNNPDRAADIQKKYKDAHPDASKKRSAIYREKNKQHARDYAKALAKRNCAELRDSYIRAKLARDTNLSCSEIPQPLVEAKRLELLIKRLVKKETLK